MGERDLAEPVVLTEARTGSWRDYVEPFRVDHWIKNLVVPVGTTLALVSHHLTPDLDDIWDALVAFLISAAISSVNYSLNEILDAPFDARHPVKRARPVPSGRVRVGPLLAVTTLLALVTFAVAFWIFPRPFALAAVALFVAGLLYNLPPLRLKDWPYLDAIVESLTNPIRIAIGWYALALSVPVSPPSPYLLGAVWAFGAFLMTGKRLAELRLLGTGAISYRPTFRAYSVPALLTVQLTYAAVGVVTLTGLFASRHPALLPSVPLVVLIVAWVFRMTFEPESPLIDPEHLYRRPAFLLLTLGVFALMVWLAAR